MQNSKRFVKIDTLDGKVEVDLENNLFFNSTMKKLNDKWDVELSYEKDGKTHKLRLSFNQNTDMSVKQMEYMFAKGKMENKSHNQAKVKN